MTTNRHDQFTGNNLDLKQRNLRKRNRDPATMSDAREPEPRWTRAPRTGLRLPEGGMSGVIVDSIDDAGRSTAEEASNVYSQLGEDGIIDFILNRFPDRNKWAVEFGAWDGLHLSNTAALAAHGYRRVLIEGSSERYLDLAKGFPDKNTTITICAQVGWEGPQTLDRILAAVPLPIDFDVLSIDIDGNDYHVWKAVEQYRPKLVVIEFNPTIRNGLRYVQPADPEVRRSSSITSLVDLATTKGYSLAATTIFNAFFVLDELFPHLGIEDNSVDAIRTDTSWLSEIFFGFDGTAIVTGTQGLAWHGLEQPSEVRLVPRILVGFPEDFGKFRRTVLRFYSIFRGMHRRRIALPRLRRRRSQSVTASS